mmetsp:Transcript_34394/g.86365  ORF Transcript_34394/g.86365 Transcript_34394/m.86365 type:complete len:205 (-) Transcript_34394:415-1029(-)
MRSPGSCSLERGQQGSLPPPRPPFPLQYSTAASALLALGRLLALRHDHTLDSLIEHLLQALLCERRALHVGNCPNLLCKVLSLATIDGCMSFLFQTVNRLLVFPQVQLCANKNNFGVGAMMRDLGPPLRFHVSERCGTDDREANQEDVGLRIGKWAKAIIILLAGSIPQSKGNCSVVHHNIGAVIIEHGGDILLRERVRCVRDQ